MHRESPTMEQSLFHVLTPEEQTVARRAFEAGRGAKYCDEQTSNCRTSMSPMTAGQPGVVIDAVQEPEVIAEPPAPPPQW